VPPLILKVKRVKEMLIKIKRSMVGHSNFESYTSTAKNELEYASKKRNIMAK